MDPSCILLVEHDVVLRNSLADYLRECGYDVIQAINAEEARQLLASRGKPVGLVLADVQSGGEGGFGLAGWIRANHPDVDVLLTGTPSKAAEKAGELCEDGPAPTTPYDHALLMERIRRLAASRTKDSRLSKSQS
jgi:DNA-binding response OmpR family regulator